MKKLHLITALPASALLLASCDSGDSNPEAVAQVVSSQSTTPSGESNNTPALQSADRSQIFTPVESSSSLMARAETFQGCTVAAGSLAAISLNNDPQKSNALLREAKMMHEIAVGYAILSGLDRESARDTLKSKKYAESMILSEASEGINVNENIELLIASYKDCTSMMMDAVNNKDATLAHVVRNFTT